MTLLTKIGIGCVTAAALVYGGWTGWMKTRKWVAVNMPVTLVVGEVRTASFTTNIPAPDVIELEAQKTIPFDVLNCLLGMVPIKSDEKCANNPEVIDAHWKIVSRGEVIASGSSSEDRGGGWAADSIAREIGSFTPRPSQQYELMLDALRDGTQLNSTNPHLKVSAPADYLEGMIFYAAFRIYPAVGVLLVTGIVLLIVSFIRFGRIQRNIVPKS